MSQQTIKLRAGLIFKSTHFRGTAEIARFDEANNTLDVIRTATDDNAWEEKGWNLREAKARFEKKEHQAYLQNPNDVNIW